MLLTLDIPDESLQAFRDLCARHRITINVETPNGPGGGNTRFTVTTDTREMAGIIGDFYFGRVA